MCQYHGGKYRTGKYIATHLKGDDDTIGYCEPFLGMGGVYKHRAMNEGKRYLAGDYNESVVKMWQGLQTGWSPDRKFTTKEEFMMLKNNGISSAEKGFIGHFFTFRGTYFDGYCLRRKSTKTMNNKIDELIHIGKQIDDVEISAGSYTQFSHLKNYVIYCDPPYSKMNKYFDEYHKKRHFDNDKFWGWVRVMSVNNKVYVSEYSAPEDFTEIWSLKEEKLYSLK